MGRTNPEITRRLVETISAYLAEYGIENDILQLGLAEDIGIGGRRLNQARNARNCRWPAPDARFLNITSSTRRCRWLTPPA